METGSAPHTVMLMSMKHLSGTFSKHSLITVREPQFTIGRSLSSSEVIACVSISRLHCTLLYNDGGCWMITDDSRYGIQVNGNKIDKSTPHTLKENDVIQLDLAGEFVYKFCSCEQVEESGARKRKFSESFNHDVEDRIQEVKDKFDNTQTIEIDNMKNKIYIAKKKQLDILSKKEILQKVLQAKFVNLQKDYECKIQELKGRHDQVEKQKELLKMENEKEKLTIEREMNDKIVQLEGRINEQRSHENELETENKILLERLAKEREEFDLRLNEVVDVKEQKLENLEIRLRQKEEELIQEKNRMESLRQQEIKKCESAKKKELEQLQEKLQAEQEVKHKEIESLKLQMQMQEHLSKETRELKEIQFQQQIENLKKESEEIRNRMTEEIAMHIAEQTEQESVRMATMEEFNREKRSLEEKLFQMDEEKRKLQELLLQKSKQSEEEMQKIQKEQSDKEAAVRQQFEKEKQQLVSLLSKESESCNVTVKQMQHELEIKSKPQDCNPATVTLCRPSEVIDLTVFDVPSTSGYISDAAKMENDKCEINRIMDAELQCSICSDLFIEPVTLNCTHTFCLHCIETWKKKKKECPVCRCKIKTQFRTNILESLISTMVETLGNEAKERRAETIRERRGSSIIHRNNSQTNGQQSTNSPSDTARGGSSAEHVEPRQTNDSNNSSDQDSASIASSEYDSDGEYSYGFQRRFYRRYSTTDEEFGSDYYTNDSEQFWSDDEGDSAEGEEPTSRSRLPSVAGLQGSYYGGYGRCYKCNHPGHWAPGCPFL